MAKRPTLEAQKRTVLGRKVKTLRKEGFLPANIFGKKIKSLALTVSSREFDKILSQVGETGLVDIKVKGEKSARPCLISDTHIHPVTDLPLHADFHQVDLTQKVTADVPVETTGESPAVKDKAAVLITLFDEIQVEALPTDLPDKFTIDISSLKEFNDAITAKDLKVDRSKVEIKLKEDQAIVMVQEPKEEEEEVPEEAPSEEGEKEAEGAEEKEEEAPSEEGEKEDSSKKEEKPEDKGKKK